MVALIAVVIIVAVTLLGGTLNDSSTQVQCQVSGGTWTRRRATAHATLRNWYRSSPRHHVPGT